MMRRRRIAHRLQPLLVPSSVAVVGATPREHATGRTVLETFRDLDFDGPLYPVNPRYGEVAGNVCHPSLADLPDPVDLAVMAVGDTRVEDQVAAAIEAGVRAVAIFGSCIVPGDREPALAERLEAMLREAGIPSIGVNCMGFCNFEAAIHVNSYRFPQLDPGRITVLAQSGSVFGCLSGSRLKPNFAASVGRETSATIVDYMDYALELGTARVLTLFLETIRDPQGFEAVLEKAQAKDVPVVALKAGRSDMAARMAVSHTGALAGDDRTIEAVFRKHGVLRASTIDELIATSLLLARARDVGDGALATIHDSGGEREMICDLASDLGVPFAAIGETTRARLGERLDYGLEAENPCDAFGTGVDHDGVMRDCFAALMDDPSTALGAFFLDVSQHSGYSRACASACLAAASTTTKPVALITNHSGTDHHDLAWDFTHNHDLPVLDGSVPGLKAISHAFWRRNWRRRPVERSEHPDMDRALRWRKRLRDADEATGLALLDDYGIATPRHAIVDSEEGARTAAGEIGYPVVLKTAMPGITHKSDVGGVVTGITDDAGLTRAWRTMARTLGRRCMVAAMAGAGIEAMVGMTRDHQFGPVVLAGAGGVLVELLDDVTAYRPPVSRREVEETLAGLKFTRLLEGWRGRAAVGPGALVDAVMKMSTMALELGSHLDALDVNPLLITDQGAVALDVLVVPRSDCS
ncbi:MAG: acetate--CoA ligase family protein [Alphaproteobacteria bacterium]|nr:acetate--CoA ligase family protein [Alphaproteobacteria bacterium]